MSKCSSVRNVTEPMMWHEILRVGSGAQHNGEW